MITLLSPAKKLNFDEPDTSLENTRPRLEEDTREIAGVAKKQTAKDLAKLMSISDNLAEIYGRRSTPDPSLLVCVSGRLYPCEG